MRLKKIIAVPSLCEQQFEKIFMYTIFEKSFTGNICFIDRTSILKIFDLQNF